MKRKSNLSFWALRSYTESGRFYLDWATRVLLQQNSMQLLKWYAGTNFGTGIQISDPKIYLGAREAAGRDLQFSCGLNMMKRD